MHLIILGSELILKEDIPSKLIRPSQAALDWINQQRGENYRLTGLVDMEAALESKPGQAYELGIVLCSGEICAREQIRIEPSGDDFRFRFLEQIKEGIPPLLDPPEGVRATWLVDQLRDKRFIILLFYRGLW